MTVKTPRWLARASFALMLAAVAMPPGHQPAIPRGTRS